MLNAKPVIILFILLMLLGCSQIKSVQKSGNVLQESPPATSSFSNYQSSDKELFSKALSYLSNENKEPNYREAKANLKQLVEQYPKSRWTPCAQALMDVVEKMKSLQNQLEWEKERLQAEQEKTIKENKYLKDNIRQNEDRYNTEIVKLQQENEKLKSDIQQLKKLEVQLEKREKMLR